MLSLVEPITSYATTPPCVVNLTLEESTSNAVLPSSANFVKSNCELASVFRMLFASLEFVTLEYAYVPTPVFINASPGSDTAATSPAKSPSTIAPPFSTIVVKLTASGAPVPAVDLASA